MSFTVLKLFTRAITFLCLLSVEVFAIDIEQLKAMEDEIYRNPDESHQKLLVLNSPTQFESVEQQLWYLYRLAQAENLLYYFDDFASTVNRATSLIDNNTSAELVASFGVYAGLVEQRNGNYVLAISHLEKALALAKKEDLTRLYIFGKQELAYTRGLTQSYEISLLDLQEAYVEAYALEDHFLIAIINEVYGALYGYMAQYEKSIEYYEKALDTYDVLGYKWHIAEATYGLAATYRYWKKYDLAVDKFKLYRERISYTPNPEINFFGTYGLGMTYAEKGDCELAVEVIDQALLLNGQIDYNAELYKRKSECLIKLERLDEARVSLDKASNIFDGLPELHGTTWQIEVRKIEGILEYAKGNADAAYKIISDYYEQYAELLISNSTEQVTRVRTNLEMERQDVEITLLQQRSKVQQLEVEQQRSKASLQYVLIVVAVCFIILILAIVYLQYRGNKRVLALSITDHLSGVYNRRYIFDYLDKLVQKTINKGGELTVLLFDIDDFKQINDQYGHPFGDEVICRVTDITQQTLRAADVVGRIGGEEFLCVLPRTDVEQSLIIAERLRSNIQSALFSTDEQEQVGITISIGISELGDDASTRNELYVQSDKALYQAKHRGKNQVVVYKTNAE